MWPFSALGSQDNLFYFSATSVKVKRNKKSFYFNRKAVQRYSTRERMRKIRGKKENKREGQN